MIGHHWFNRIAPAILRAAGLEELIATTHADFVRQMVRLVDDSDYRQALADRVAAVDLKNTVYTVQGVPEFLQFMRTITRDPQAYPGQEPIDLG